MGEVDSKRFAPNTKVTDLLDGQVTRKGDDQGFAIILLQWLEATVLVSHLCALGRRLLTAAHPELCVWQS